MFLGEHSHALDSKGRLTIPARFREELEKGLVIIRGYEPCLVVYPLAAWQSLSGRAAQMPSTSAAARSYNRLTFGGAHETTLDKMGRVLLPAFLRDYAGIQEEAIVVGVNTTIEIWAPPRWREVWQRDRERLEEIQADVAKMGI
jgi:MraZ protein